MALPKEQQNIIVGAVAGVVILFMLILKIYIPMGKDIDTLEKKIAGLNQKIVLMKAQAQQLDKLKRESEILKLEVAESQKMLPKNVEMDDLLRLITEAAQKIGIYISQFDPLKIISRDYYVEIPINLKIQTTYHNLARFIVALSQSERIISAKNIKINRFTSNDKKNKNTINSSFSLNTYMSR